MIVILPSLVIKSVSYQLEMVLRDNNLLNYLLYLSAGTIVRREEKKTESERKDSMKPKEKE